MLQCWIVGVKVILTRNRKWSMRQQNLKKRYKFSEFQARQGNKQMYYLRNDSNLNNIATNVDWNRETNTHRIRPNLSSTVIDSSERTLSCSKEYGCSGSLISLTKFANSKSRIAVNTWGIAEKQYENHYFTNHQENVKENNTQKTKNLLIPVSSFGISIIEIPSY